MSNIVLDSTEYSEAIELAKKEPGKRNFNINFALIL